MRHQAAHLGKGSRTAIAGIDHAAAAVHQAQVVLEELRGGDQAAEGAPLVAGLQGVVVRPVAGDDVRGGGGEGAPVAAESRPGARLAAVDVQQQLPPHPLEGFRLGQLALKSTVGLFLLSTTSLFFLFLFLFLLFLFCFLFRLLLLNFLLSLQVLLVEGNLLWWWWW